MLRWLQIENLVLAREVSLEFSPALTLITGETGAGKSLISGAIALALGGRAETSVVRQGEERALVAALFDLSERPDIAQRLVRSGYPLTDHELLIRREITADGRSKAFLGGAAITLALLKELTAGLVELHGQNEAQTLLAADTHRSLLDRFGRIDELVAEVRRAHSLVRDTQGKLAALNERSVQRQARLDLLRFRLGELDATKPRPGEETQLRQERDRLRHGEAIAEALRAAIDGIYEGEGAAQERVHAAARRLRAQAAHDEQFGELADRLDDLRSGLQDIAAELRDQLDALAADPGRLSAIEERLVVLERLRRRFDGAALDDILADTEPLRRELAELEGHHGSAAELEAERDAQIVAYRELALRLSAARRGAGEAFAAKVGQLIAGLAMKHAELRVDIQSLAVESMATQPAGAEGVDQVEFLLAANPGEPARPLRRVASGGELSRVMLAMDIALEAGLPRRTLLFDEVDQGLGGEAADRLGEFLTRVSRHHQVIVITHLPQVAARGERHIHVSKKLKAGRTVAVVKQLEDTDDRVEEIARMLGGSYITDTARRHAEAMLRGEGETGATG